MTSRRKYNAKFKVWIRWSRKVSNKKKLQRLVRKVSLSMCIKAHEIDFLIRHDDNLYNYTWICIHINVHKQNIVDCLFSGTTTTCTCAWDQGVATQLVTWLGCTGTVTTIFFRIYLLFVSAWLSHTAGTFANAQWQGWWQRGLRLFQKIRSLLNDFLGRSSRFSFSSLS